MSDSFTVAADSDRIRLGSDRGGHAGYTAVNTTSRGLRGVGRLIPLGNAAPGWFNIDGDAQRPFAPGGSQKFDVMIQVPTTAPEGEYNFRFDVVGVENPDVDYGRSRDTTVVVPAVPAPPTARGKGYVAALVGSVVGGVVGVLVGTLPGALFLIAAIHQVAPTNPNQSFGDAIAGAFASVLAEVLVAALLFVLGLVLGVWVGPVLGVFIALRTRAQTLVGLTVGILVAFQAVITILLLILLGVLGKAIKNQGAVIAMLAALAVIDVALPAILARGAARLIRLRHL